MDINTQMQFYDLIKKGDLSEIKEYYNINFSRNKLDQKTHQNAFIDACDYGNIEVAKWLFEVKPEYPIIYINAFFFACKNGHLEIAKWLLELNPDMDISINNNYIFNIVREFNQMEIAKWLCSIKPELVSL